MSGDNMHINESTEYAAPSTWNCDTCGEQVGADDGYVIWDSHGRAHDFRIIHKGRCDVEDLHSSTALKDLVGTVGIAHLLSFLTTGPLMGADGESHDLQLNLTDYVDLFRRLHVPNYERARLNFDKSGVRDFVAGWNERAPYFPDELARIAEVGEGEDIE